MPACKGQFSSVAQSCPTLCDHMDCRTPGLPVHHHHKCPFLINPLLSTTLLLLDSSLHGDIKDGEGRALWSPLERTPIRFRPRSASCIHSRRNPPKIRQAVTPVLRDSPGPTSLTAKAKSPQEPSAPSRPAFASLIPAPSMFSLTLFWPHFLPRTGHIRFGKFVFAPPSA